MDIIKQYIQENNTEYNPQNTTLHTKMSISSILSHSVFNDPESMNICEIHQITFIFEYLASNGLVILKYSSKKSVLVRKNSATSFSLCNWANLHLVFYLIELENLILKKIPSEIDKYNCVYKQVRILMPSDFENELIRLDKITENISWN